MSGQQQGNQQQGETVGSGVRWRSASDGGNRALLGLAACAVLSIGTAIFFGLSLSGFVEGHSDRHRSIRASLEQLHQRHTWSTTPAYIIDRTFSGLSITEEVEALKQQLAQLSSGTTPSETSQRQDLHTAGQLLDTLKRRLLVISELRNRWLDADPAPPASEETRSLATALSGQLLAESQQAREIFTELLLLVYEIEERSMMHDTALVRDLLGYEWGIALLLLSLTVITLVECRRLTLDLRRQRRRLSHQDDVLSAGLRDLARQEFELHEVDNAKTRFLAQMSHEIRTPLTALIGFGEVLRRPDLTPEETRAAQDAIQRNGDHLLRLVDDVLDLAKSRAGNLTLEVLPTDPVDLLRDGLETLRSLAQKRSLHLELEVIGEIPELLELDPTRIRQVLLNLTGNALKYTEVGGVTVQIECRGGGSEECELLISVVDTGIGLSEEALRKVFDPFTQADESMTRRYGGTGLGLSISREIADEMGGTLSATSVEGLGSRFVFSVPARRCGPDAAPPEATAVPVLMERALSRLRILVAEDGIDNQELLTFILRREGAEVRVVENGRQAVEVALDAELSSAPYDVVLMDMQMPVLDGYSATRELRDRGYLGKIIALTANHTPDERARCLACGCDDYQSKPIRREVLIDAVHSMVSKSA